MPEAGGREEAAAEEDGTEAEEALVLCRVFWIAADQSYAASAAAQTCFFIEAPPCVDVSRICPALSAVFNIDVFCIRVVTKAVETKKWLSQNALQKHFATAIFVGGRTVF